MRSRGARVFAHALRRDPVLLGLLGYSAVVCAWYLTGWVGVGGQVVGFWVLQLPIDAVLYVLCRRVARLPGMPAPARRFWNAFAFSVLFFAAGDLIQSADRSIRLVLLGQSWSGALTSSASPRSSNRTNRALGHSRSTVSAHLLG